MKDESEPIAPSESLVRLVWKDHYNPALPLPVQPRAFEPKPGETDGISVFRFDCLNTPGDSLGAIAEPKKGMYAVVTILVRDIEALGLTVRPDPIAAVHGHCVVPEINIAAYKAAKRHWNLVLESLAKLASQNILVRPTA